MVRLDQHAESNLDRLGIEYLIAIGGDGTLATTPSVEKKLGVKVIGIPKSMDNDVRNTDYFIGFSTAITRERLQTTAADTVGSRERYGLCRFRNSSQTPFERVRACPEADARLLA